MTTQRPQRRLSEGGFIFLIVLAALTVMTDVTALVVVSVDMRATEAAYAVYGVAVLLSLAVGILLLVYRREIKSFVGDTVASAKLVARLRKYNLFERAFTDYGWRTLVAAAFVLTGNIVYVAYLVWMAVAYKSPWYAALAGFYAWLVIMRGGVIAAEKCIEKKSGLPSAPLKDKYVISLISGVTLIIAGGVVAAPVVQMAIGTYPRTDGVANIVINAVFAFVKCVSAIVQLVRAFAYKDPVTRELRNISLVTALMSLLTLQVSIIIVFAHGYTMWEYVTGLGVIVSVTTIAVGTLSVARGGIALTGYRKAGKECGTRLDGQSASVTTQNPDGEQNEENVGDNSSDV